MENPSRNLGQDSEIISPARTHKVPRHWTVLLIGDLGKIASFRIGKPLLLAFTASLCAVLAVVICSLVSYMSVRLENTRLRKDLDTLRVQLETSENAKERALVGLMVREGSVKPTARKASPASDRKTKDVSSRVRKPSPAATKTAKVRAPETLSPAVMASQPTRAEKDKISPPVSPANILVKNLEIWQGANSNDFKFRFTLKNVDSERGKIAGHTFVVLKPEEGSEEPSRAFPWSPLKDGKPVIFKRGRYFSISNFKLISGTLTDVSTIGRFKTATVYVYSDTGDPLAEEVFEVDKTFRS